MTGEVSQIFSHPAIDQDFQSLIPPLSADELAQLEANIKAEGCRDPLVIWQENGILVDGHNRLSICKRLDLAYKIEWLSFQDRGAATNWIITNQLGRRNLSPDQASYLRGKLYNAEKDAKGGDRGNQYTAAKGQNDTLPTARLPSGDAA